MTELRAYYEKNKHKLIHCDHDGQPVLCEIIGFDPRYSVLEEESILLSLAQEKVDGLCDLEDQGYNFKKCLSGNHELLSHHIDNSGYYSRIMVPPKHKEDRITNKSMKRLFYYFLFIFTALLSFFLWLLMSDLRKDSSTLPFDLL